MLQVCVCVREKGVVTFLCGLSTSIYWKYVSMSVSLCSEEKVIEQYKLLKGVSRGKAIVQ